MIDTIDLSLDGRRQYVACVRGIVGLLDPDAPGIERCEWIAYYVNRMHSVGIERCQIAYLYAYDVGIYDPADLAWDITISAPPIAKRVRVWIDDTHIYPELAERVRECLERDAGPGCAW